MRCVALTGWIRRGFFQDVTLFGEDLVLASQTTELLALARGQAGALAGIPLGLAHPAAQGFRADPEFLADRPNCGPLRRMLGGVLEDHPDGAFTHLRGILAGSSHGLHPLSERALR